MPSPPSDGGTHPPPPWTDHSNDAVLRGGGGRGGGDGRGLPDSAIGAAGDRRDVSRDKESKGHVKHLLSGSSTLGKFEAGLQSDTLAVEDGSSSFKISGLSKEQTKSCVNDDHSKYPKLGYHFFPYEENRNTKSAVDGKYTEAMPEKKSEIMDARNTKPFSVPGKGAAVVIPMRDVFGEEANIVQCSNKEIKQIDFQSPEEMNQRASRLAASLLRRRSLSPTDSKDENKRPAIICQYFSQGWCVNGPNCKFMHNIDSMDNTNQQIGGDVAIATRRYESQADKGLSEIPERTTLFCFPGRVRQWENEESLTWHQYNGKHRFSSLQRDDLSYGFPADSQRFPMYKDGPRNYVSPNTEGSYPILGNRLFPEYGSFSVGSSTLAMSSKTYQTSRTLSSKATSLEGLAGKQNEFTLNDYASPVLSHQPNPRVDTTLQTTNLLPSHQSSAWGGYSFSQNAGPCVQKCVDSDTKTKFSSDDWEPSIPFRPSYFSAFTDMSSARSVHDTVGDTCEEHPLGDRPYKVSCPTQGASILGSSHQRVYHDPVLPGTLGPEYNADIESIHIHDKFDQSTLDKGVYGHQRDFFTNETEPAGSSVAELQDSQLKEGKPDGHTRVEDVSDQNPRNYSDGASHEEELKMEWGKQSNAKCDDHKIDEDVQKESKALRHFRFVLIDFIKDLVRPTWHRGQLSKDAHNSIVKRSVDKVLSTLEPHQIPSTEEAIHHYLSVSQPKIAKLIQGYVEKHRRMNSGISVL